MCPGKNTFVKVYPGLGAEFPKIQGDMGKNICFSRVKNYPYRKWVILVKLWNPLRSKGLTVWKCLWKVWITSCNRFANPARIGGEKEENILDGAGMDMVR